MEYVNNSFSNNIATIPCDSPPAMVTKNQLQFTPEEFNTNNESPFGRDLASRDLCERDHDSMDPNTLDYQEGFKNHFKEQVGP